MLKVAGRDVAAAVSGLGAVVGSSLDDRRLQPPDDPPSPSNTRLGHRQLAAGGASTTAKLHTNEGSIELQKELQTYQFRAADH